jgi:uncharacterized protein (DUF1330 family)
MGSVRPEEGRLAAFVQEPIEGSIVMINLLRYREQAEYEADSDEAPCSGEDAYARYGAAVVPLVEKHGGRAVWVGRVSATLIAPEGEDWDSAALIEYPSREAFLAMVASLEYRQVEHHRTAALSDSRLICVAGGGGPLAAGPH